MRSRAFQLSAAFLCHHLLRFIYRTNRLDAASSRQYEMIEREHPVIFVVWHGQHFLLPYVYDITNGKGLVTLVSRSLDAQINAMVLQKAGHQVVRGSGGRVRQATQQKGGVSAILALRKALEGGKDVGIIADISKGAPRQSGRGVVHLAKISGRPIIPLAFATSRYKVFERSWDKTTMNLPFGRSCFRIGNPIYVAAESSNDVLDRVRLKVDEELNRITDEVYSVVSVDQ